MMSTKMISSSSNRPFVRFVCTLLYGSNDFFLSRYQLEFSMSIRFILYINKIPGKDLKLLLCNNFLKKITVPQFFFLLCKIYTDTEKKKNLNQIIFNK